jgi:spore germination cell wall hydrolase CwlJ-like protein
MTELTLRLFIALLGLFPASLLSLPTPSFKMPSEAAIACLAAIKYYEARGEGKIGQEAVAHVALNRTEKRGLSVCGVLKQPFQFAFMNKRKGIPPTPPEFKEKAKKMLLLHIHGYREDFTMGSQYFVGNHIVHTQSWLKKLKKTMTIGGHTFFKEKRK